MTEPQGIPESGNPGWLMAQAHRGVLPVTFSIERIQRIGQNPSDAAALMDLSQVLQFHGQRDAALAHQARALQVSRLYHHPMTKPAAVRVLCVVAPGDVAVNMPIELMLLDSDVELIKLFLVPGEPLPSSLPEHDLTVVAISEFDETEGVLDQLGAVIDDWPRPVLNDPRRIRHLARDRIASLLDGIPGLVVPPTARLAGRELIGLDPALFPLIARPVGSHGGKGLERLETPAALDAYAGAHLAGDHYVSPFVDYRGADGLYRKYRIALIGGQPYLGHMAMADHWMLHYWNAGMDADPAKRTEEACVFAAFHQDFAVRHRAALDVMSERMGLDYVVIDCAEMPDGRLLFFEADNAGAIHDLDPPEVFPYKSQPMRGLFDAFRGLLDTVAGRHGR